MKGIISGLLASGRVRRSRLAAWMLFGFSPHPANRMTLWDNTSLAYRKALRRWVKEGDHVLEIGTGDVGLLSLYLIRKKKVILTASDLFPEFIENARRNARRLKADIGFVCGDLFDIGQAGPFDMIFFNPPYVRSERCRVQKLLKYHGFATEKMALLTSDGGEDGLRVVERYLAGAVKFLKPNGSVLVGYNSNHVHHDGVLELTRRYGYTVTGIIRSSRSKVEILKLSADE
jgi:methylase of polypeptide subunit release factors